MCGAGVKIHLGVCRTEYSICFCEVREKEVKKGGSQSAG